MKTALCTEFGIDEREVRRRLSMFDINQQDVENMRWLRQTIADEVNHLVAAFYEHIRQFEELARFIASGQRLNALSVGLIRHLLTLGENVYQPKYFEHRLRVGMAHEQLGLQPKWYVGAYAFLRAKLNRILLENENEGFGHRAEVLISLNKFMCLDLELALEAYHRRSMSRIEILMNQLEAGQDEIRKLAQTDQLTGLPNRRHFMEQLEAEFVRSKRYNRPLCLVLMDLDDFKSINDRYGHLTGDTVLRAVGHLLPSLVRSSDVCGRLGGEELAVALVETTPPTAELIAERIRLAILQHEYDTHLGRFSISVSVGIASCTDEMAEVTDLIRAADDALYQAKGAGKNQVCMALAGTT